MQNRPNPPRPALFRRILFPYSGNEVLTIRQGLRVVLAWILFIPLPMTLCALPVSLVIASSLYKALVMALLVFGSGALIFGLLGCFIVGVNNWAVRVRDERQARKSTVDRGGRHGS
ncbi:MAG: hypothetical protein H0W02_15480 [Ktedonobacteraceae bacterium]|nr:hypothetical protein [Ktedonobacteraceae bacterium]